jgi:hypothetical protein
MELLVIKLIKNKVFWSLAVLTSFIILGFILRWEALEIVRINFWLTRDFDRSFNLFDGNYIPLAGPETTNGLRLPGPALYFFTIIPLWFKYSYESIFTFYFLLNFSSIILTFWIVKKYIDFYTAILTTILQLIYPLSIEAITFPINPTFLLPIIPFLFWSIFEFTLNKNEKILPLILLIILLGIQIHLSIAIFLIVPIVWVLIFKVKISLTTFFRTFLVILICFAPFVIYLLEAYTPNIQAKSVTKVDPFSSFIEPIKIITVQNTIKRLVDHGIGAGNMSNFIGIPKFHSFIKSIILNSSLFGLLLYIFFTFRRGKIDYLQKPLLILFLFYLPALIYDFIRPWEMHFWYNYVFILPTALLISFSLTTFYKIAKPKALKVSISLVAFALISYFTLFNTKYFYSVKRDIQNKVSIGDYQNFKQLTLFQKSIFEKYDLSAKDFIHQVYIEEVNGYSPKLISLLDTTDTKQSKPNQIKVKSPCFYIFGMENLAFFDKPIFIEKNRKLSSFSRDPTIKVFKSDVFTYHKRVYGVKKYLPKFNQPCYQNSSNIFQTTIKDKKLLSDYSQFQKNNNSFFEKKIDFDEKGKIEKLKISSIYQGLNTKIPIRFNIFLSKILENHILKVEIDSYGWGHNSADLFTFDRLNLEISNGLSSSNQPLNIPIISPKSWISEGFGIPLEKLSWYRQFSLPINFKLPKDKLLLKISGKIKFPKRAGSCCEPLVFPINITISNNPT